VSTPRDNLAHAMVAQLLHDRRHGRLPLAPADVLLKRWLLLLPPCEDSPGLAHGEVAIGVAGHSPDADSRHGRHGRRHHCLKGSLAGAFSQAEQANLSRFLFTAYQ
jgi:hypothetical protein